MTYRWIMAAVVDEYTGMTMLLAMYHARINPQL